MLVLLGVIGTVSAHDINIERISPDQMFYPTSPFGQNLNINNTGTMFASVIGHNEHTAGNLADITFSREESPAVTPTPTPPPAPAGFVYVFPGEYIKGSPWDEPCRDDDETKKYETVEHGIFIMQTEVTRSMWADLKAAMPELPDDPSGLETSPTMDHPVQQVTWNEAILFANLMSLRDGYTQCYYLDEAFAVPVDETNYQSEFIHCNFKADGYRLPTEVEWEYAARAGTDGPFSCDEPDYNTETCDRCEPGVLTQLEQYAVFCANHSGGAAIVGSKSANPWGLYDMHGNVWEWCFENVRRGGGWFNSARHARSANKSAAPPFRNFNLGFRLVMTADGIRPTPTPGGPTATPTPTPTGPTPTPSPKFVYIEPGTFIMGSPNTEACRDERSEGQLTVTLTRGFYMMTTEINRQMWADLKVVQPGLPDDPSSIYYCPTLQHPVQNVTWFEAVLFANLLSLQEGRNVVYYVDESLTTPLDPENYTDGSVYLDDSAEGYRLPTFAEWEYAARAGTTGPFSCPEPRYSEVTCSELSCTPGRLPTLEQHAVFCANSPGGPDVVGTKLPNPWGLFDMHGNVWEWCCGTEPTPYKPFRGGSSDREAQYLRSAARNKDYPGNRLSRRGFRLVRFGLGA